MKIERASASLRSITRLFSAAALFVLASAGGCRAAFIELAAGARSAALAGAQTAACGRADALFCNPAGIWRPGGSDLVLFHTRPFGLADVSRITLSAGLAAGGMTLGLAHARLSRSPYVETETAVSVALPCAGFAVLGAAVRRAAVRITGYGAAESIPLDLGCVLFRDKRVSLGFCRRNALGARIGREPLPGFFHCGARLEPVTGARLFFDIAGRFADSRFGAEMEAGSGLVLRFGAAHAPSRITAGFALSLGPLQCEYAFDAHPVLETTHLFAVRMTF